MKRFSIVLLVFVGCLAIVYSQNPYGLEFSIKPHSDSEENYYVVSDTEFYVAEGERLSLYLHIRNHNDEEVRISNLHVFFELNPDDENPYTVEYIPLESVTLDKAGGVFDKHREEIPGEYFNYYLPRNHNKVNLLYSDPYSNPVAPIIKDELGHPEFVIKVNYNIEGSISIPNTRISDEKLGIFKVHIVTHDTLKDKRTEKDSEDTYQTLSHVLTGLGIILTLLGILVRGRVIFLLGGLAILLWIIAGILLKKPEWIT